MDHADRKLLIVNADDLGRTPGINQGIFDAHRRGVVTSATLMVGFPAAEEAAGALPGLPDLGVGLHVALTGGRPTLPAERVPSLVDGDGLLPRKPEGLGDVDPDEVLAEVRSQLERFRQLTGRDPTHLDSHHHSHRLPVVLDALVRVARENALPVRNASPEVGRRLRREGIATTDAFVDRFFGDEARLDVLLEIVGSARSGARTAAGGGSTEVMCHPARVDEALRSDSSYVDERVREIEVLTSLQAREAVEAAGLRLGHFGHLAGRRSQASGGNARRLRTGPEGEEAP